MPYTIRKIGGGFKVGKADSGKTFSKKPLSKKRAVAQLRAIEVNSKHDFAFASEAAVSRPLLRRVRSKITGSIEDLLPEGAKQGYEIRKRRKEATELARSIPPISPEFRRIMRVRRRRGMRICGACDGGWESLDPCEFARGDQLAKMIWKKRRLTIANPGRIPHVKYALPLPAEMLNPPKGSIKAKRTADWMRDQRASDGVRSSSLMLKKQNKRWLLERGPSKAVRKAVRTKLRMVGLLAGGAVAGNAIGQSVKERQGDKNWTRGKQRVKNALVTATGGGFLGSLVHEGKSGLKGARVGAALGAAAGLLHDPKKRSKTGDAMASGGDWHFERGDQMRKILIRNVGRTDGLADGLKAPVWLRETQGFPGVLKTPPRGKGFVSRHMAGTVRRLRQAEKTPANVIRVKFISRLTPIELQIMKEPRPTVAGVAADRYKKQIKEKDYERGTTNYIKAGAAGTGIGLLLRKTGTLKRAAAIGAAGGLAAQGAVRLVTRATKDKFGERSHRGKLADKAVPTLGEAGAAILGYRKLAKTAAGHKIGLESRLVPVMFGSGGTQKLRRAFRSLTKKEGGFMTEESRRRARRVVQRSDASDERSRAKGFGPAWRRTAGMGLESRLVPTEFSLNRAQLAKHLISGGALAGGIAASDAVTSGTFAKKGQRRKQAIHGLKVGTVYGGTLAATEPFIAAGLRKLSKLRVIRNSRIEKGPIIYFGALKKAALIGGAGVLGGVIGAPYGHVAGSLAGHKEGKRVMIRAQGDHVNASDELRNYPHIKQIAGPEDVPSTFGRFKSHAIRHLAKTAAAGKNAYALPANKKHGDFVILPKTANRSLIQHEIGHIRDNAKSRIGVFEHGMIGDIRGTTLKREKAAWSYVKNPDEQLKHDALTTYKKRQTGTRAGAAIGAGIGAGTAWGILKHTKLSLVPTGMIYFADRPRRSLEQNMRDVAVGAGALGVGAGAGLVGVSALRTAQIADDLHPHVKATLNSVRNAADQTAKTAGAASKTVQQVSRPFRRARVIAYKVGRFVDKIPGGKFIKRAIGLKAKRRVFLSRVFFDNGDWYEPHPQYRRPAPRRVLTADEHSEVRRDRRKLAIGAGVAGAGAVATAGYLGQDTAIGTKMKAAYNLNKGRGHVAAAGAAWRAGKAHLTKMPLHVVPPPVATPAPVKPSKPTLSPQDAANLEIIKKHREETRPERLKKAVERIQKQKQAAAAPVTAAAKVKNVVKKVARRAAKVKKKFSAIDREILLNSITYHDTEADIARRKAGSHREKSGMALKAAGLLGTGAVAAVTHPEIARRGEHVLRQVAARRATGKMVLQKSGAYREKLSSRIGSAVMRNSRVAYVGAAFAPAVLAGGVAGYQHLRARGHEKATIRSLKDAQELRKQRNAKARGLGLSAAISREILFYRGDQITEHPDEGGKRAHPYKAVFSPSKRGYFIGKRSRSAESESNPTGKVYESVPVLHRQVVHRAFKDAKGVAKWGQRGHAIVKDTHDVVRGIPRGRDATGRKKKREWEKSWFKNAAVGAAGGAAILGGLRHMKANPTGKLATHVKDTVDTIRNIKRAAGFSAIDSEILLDETQGEWDIRDARGKSARVFAPGSRGRQRREKMWHEKLDNERKLWAGGTIAAGLAGAAIAKKGSALLRFLPKAPQVEKAVVRARTAPRGKPFSVWAAKPRKKGVAASQNVLPFNDPAKYKIG